MKSAIFSWLRRGPLKVTVLGAGNWGTAIGKICAENAADSYIFDDEVRLWVHDEEVEGKSLVDIINSDHVNVKYLPDVPLPTNLNATSDLRQSIEDANLLVFAMPHSFLVNVCKQLKGHVSDSAMAISLIKGFLIEDNSPRLCSKIIESTLDIECCVLSGANVAKDIARGQFSETTVGYDDRLSAAIWQQLFDRNEYFRVNCIPDIHGVELCGAVKNVIALAAGFSQGLGYGTNTEAAVIRLGVDEMRQFGCAFFEGVLEETFFDSAGYADVITTCMGGRNSRAAKEFILRKGTASWQDIEKDLLRGQKLQGHLVCQEIHSILAAHQLEEKFPLFVATYRIAFEGANPLELLKSFQGVAPRRIKLAAECKACISTPEATSPKRAAH